MFALSAGYAGLGARIFCKQPDGIIPIWIKILHFPFMLYSYLIWHIARLTSRENAVDRVSANLYLGRRLLPGEVPEGVVNYVDLTAELEDPMSIRDSTNYIKLPILDGDVPGREALRTTLSHLCDEVTYVHCAQGHGRTGLFALAVLAERGIVSSFQEGMAMVKAARPGISLNKEQEDFIRGYIAEQCGGE